MAWNFSAIVRDAEELSEDIVRAMIPGTLTEVEMATHIPAAVAAAKAIFETLKADVAAIEMEGKDAADKTADPSHVTVSVTIPAAPAVVAPVAPAASDEAPVVDPSPAPVATPEGATVMNDPAPVSDLPAPVEVPPTA